MLAVLIKSIEVNHVSGEQIDFYIVEDQIRPVNKSKIIASLQTPLITLKWINLLDILPSHINLPADHSSFPLNIYARLFIPYFVPEHIKKSTLYGCGYVGTKRYFQIMENQSSKSNGCRRSG